MNVEVENCAKCPLHDTPRVESDVICAAWVVQTDADQSVDAQIHAPDASQDCATGSNPHFPQKVNRITHWIVCTFLFQGRCSLGNSTDALIFAVFFHRLCTFEYAEGSLFRISYRAQQQGVVQHNVHRNRCFRGGGGGGGFALGSPWCALQP